MTSGRPTVRTLAVELGLSRSTVSNALRGLPGVNAETRERVQSLAGKRGYSTHPFATRIMSQLRRESTNKHVGTLALLELEEPDRPPGAVPFHRELAAGVKKRAAEIGFDVWHQTFGQTSGLTLRRIDEIMQARGIQGVVLLPTWSDPDFRALDWKRYAGVYIDYSIEHPRLHTVCGDHFRLLYEAVEKAVALGYRRPGFVLGRRSNQRLHSRLVGGLLGYLHDHPQFASVPILLEDEMNDEKFTRWFVQHTPDVVITAWIEAPRCMRAAGARIPGTHGYICLNLMPAKPGTSGFDFQPRLLGERAAESVCALLEHNDQGIPKVASALQVPARWVEGSTVRRMKGA